MLSKSWVGELLYVPGLHQNLLSVGLREAVWNSDQQENVLYLYWKRKCTSQSRDVSNRLFPLFITSFNRSMCLNTTIDMNWLWQWGFNNFDSLSELPERKMVLGLAYISKPKKVCEVCTLGKKHRKPFPLRKSARAKKPMELVHSDLCWCIINWW